MIKSLEFLNMPQYRIDTIQQKIYRFHFWQSGLNEEKCKEIKKKYLNKQLSQEKLAKQYCVSHGTITNILNWKNSYWIEMKSQNDGKGYICYTLINNKKSKRYYLHKILCEIFNGPCPKGMEVRHLDGNKLNNSENNLCYGTHKQNCQDNIKHDVVFRPQGEKSGKAKLKNEDILMIRYLWENEFCNQVQISKIYNLASRTISMIVNRERWKHI